MKVKRHLMNLAQKLAYSIKRESILLIIVKITPHFFSSYFDHLFFICNTLISYFIYP
jgi:hypothetical protein